MRSYVEAFKEAPGTTLPPLVDESLNDDFVDTANDQITLVLQNDEGQLASELDENNDEEHKDQSCKSEKEDVEYQYEHQTDPINRNADASLAKTSMTKVNT